MFPSCSHLPFHACVQVAVEVYALTSRKAVVPAEPVAALVMRAAAAVVAAAAAAVTAEVQQYDAQTGRGKSTPTALFCLMMPMI